MSPERHSFYEATARERVLGLTDPKSFREFVPFHERMVSPHLPLLGLPVAFNDGVIVGSALLGAKPILVAAQEGAFQGGAVGEVHGAKLTGLLERACEEKPAAVLLLLDSGGVRLHEANAGLIAVSEIMRARAAAHRRSSSVRLDRRRQRVLWRNEHRRPHVQCHRHERRGAARALGS